MKETDALAAKSMVNEQVYKISERNRIVSVKVKGQSWTSVCLKDREVARNRRRDPVVRFTLSPGTYTIKTDGKIEEILSKDMGTPTSLIDQLKAANVAQLRLTSDASDRHLVDGISQIPADGNSTCRVTVEKIGPDGELSSGKEDRDRVYLRSTGGTLLNEENDERIRSLDLSLGKATFRIRSEKQPKVVTIYVFGKAPIVGKAELQIEFV